MMANLTARKRGHGRDSTTDMDVGHGKNGITFAT